MIAQYFTMSFGLAFTLVFSFLFIIIIVIFISVLFLWLGYLFKFSVSTGFCEGLIFLNRVTRRYT